MNVLGKIAWAAARTPWQETDLTPKSVDEITQRIKARFPLWIITVKIPEWRLIEPPFGPQRQKQILTVAAEVLHRGGDDGRSPAPLKFFLSPACLAAIFYRQLDQSMETKILSRLSEIGVKKQDIEIGWCSLQEGDTADNTADALAALQNTVKMALQMGQDPQGWQKAALRQRILTIAKASQISVLFQPIVDLVSGQIFGVEALSRGPAGSPFENPAALFPAAEQSGCLFQIEHVCREKAIAVAASNELKAKLFLNINPQIINDQNFEPGVTMRSLQRLGFNPNNIVFEITERQAISDYGSFCRALGHYRRQGFLVAVDDAGAGYSSLQAISELKPDFVKLDMSLVRDLNANPVRLAICEALIGVSRRIGARVIAEGIESGEELRTVAGLGADYGQGYFLARPSKKILRQLPELTRLSVTMGTELFREASGQVAAAEN